MRGVIWCAGAVVLLITVGCADNRPVYKEPAIALSQAATLRGWLGTYIEEIDGARIETATIQMSNFGFNGVHITPGEHRVTIHQNISNARTATQVVTKFNYRFEAGHTYDAGPYSFWKPWILKLTDKTTGQSFAFEPEEAQSDSPSDHTPGYLYDLMGA